MSAVIKQKSYERIEYVLHRHPLTFLPRVLSFLVLLAIPVALTFMVNTLFPSLLASPVLYAIVILLGSIYYLCTIMLFYTQFTEFFLDLWIITNDRVIDIEQIGLFARTISEFDLFQIQDITTDVHGFFPTVCHYGNVTIKTASSNAGIVFHNISRPDFIRQELLRLADIDRRYHTGELKPQS